MTKRILSLLLTALMLTSAVSCGADQSETSNKTESASGSASSETSIEYLDELPNNLDFGGTDIRFLSVSGNGEFYVDLEEDDIADPVVEAVWKRNNLLTERINVNIVQPVQISKDDLNSTVQNSVAAGSDDYDILNVYARFNMEIAAQGLVKNLDTINYLDFTKNYWNDNYITNLSYNNIHYWAGGDISTNYMTNARAIFANLNLWKQRFPSDSLYDIVMNGNWTLDEFATRIQDTYIDTNGDGIRDVTDTYGFMSDTGAGTTNCLMFGAGMAFTKYEEEGVPALDIPSEHNLAVFDYYHDFLFNNQNVFYDEAIMDVGEGALFAQGKALFVNAQVGWIDDNVRNMEDDFYLIPAPKYDTLQEEYRVTQQDGFNLIGVPVTAQAEKLDAIGASLEGMSSMASTLIFPAYYETTLKDKYSRNPEAQDLIDLIHDSIIADFCLGWCDSVGYMGNSTLQIFAKNIQRESITSVLEKNMKVYEKGLEMLLENFDKYMEN